MSKKKVNTKPLSGFMELLPQDQIAFDGMRDTIRESYELSGFVPIDTPIIERAATLLAKAGGETEKQIYRFTKGETDLALRFDLTVPLARYVAEHYGDLTFPFKRYAIGKVFRGERAQAGRFREFYQCDIDVIGDNTLDIAFDAEIPSVIYSIFTKFDFGKFTMRVNNRKVLNGLFDGLNIADKSVEVMRSIDKLEKIGFEAVAQELTENGVTTSAIESILQFLDINGKTGDVLKSLEGLSIDNEQFCRGIEELRIVTEKMIQFGIPESYFVIDLTIARGLDYYTGTVYETQLDKYPEIGSVCSGGRYDNLAGTYTNRTLPGVGISIGITRLFDQLKKRNLITSQMTLTRVFVVSMTDDTNVSLKLAMKLRTSGIVTEVSFSQGKLKKKLGYANKKGIQYVVLIGEDEIANENYTVKNFVTGEQKVLTETELIRQLKK